MFVGAVCVNTRPPATDPGCPLPGCLYDIIADPGEFHNLAAQQPADLERLTKALYGYVPSLFQSDLQPGNNGTYDCDGCFTKARGEYAPATSCLASACR